VREKRFIQKLRYKTDNEQDRSVSKPVLLSRGPSNIARKKRCIIYDNDDFYSHNTIDLDIHLFPSNTLHEPVLLNVTGQSILHENF